LFHEINNIIFPTSKENCAKLEKLVGEHTIFRPSLNIYENERCVEKLVRTVRVTRPG
jgi:hypothetical protein